MAKNAGESRIPVPRTVRPSLLPKIRSLGPPKISTAGHRRSPPVYCSNNANNKQQFPNNKTASTTNLVLEAPPVKQSKPRVCDTPEDKDILDIDYSISAIWNSTTDNKEAEHLMRLNDDKLGILCSQEDLTNYVCKKSHQSHEDISGGINDTGNVDYAIESPATTTPHYLMLTKQNSFEHDESLGILTPDQMTDFTVALESSRTPSCENLSGSANSNKFLLSKSSEVVAAAARHLDLAARLPSIEALVTANDRSPSLEELPLDPKPVVIIAEDVELLEASLNEKSTGSSSSHSCTQAELSTKTLAVDSAETSEHTSEPTTTRSTSVGGSHVLPTSFVTSVTSITSLEAGYQGDGENSRPASRGPEPLSIAPATNLLVGATCRQDPMTDSDFFTESDADAHEEIVRGDRLAQVIDGTLFCAPHERRCLNFEAGEEMDSSGIYSDIDKRQDGAVGDAEGYGDGDHTTDTGDTEVSMKSQPSPRDKTPVPCLVTKNILSPQEVFNETIDSNSTLSTAEVTVIKCQKNEQNTATKSKSSGISNKENSVPLKKYKMPKRNVISKIKTMIEANNAKEETESEPRRPQRQQRKNGRWEAVMNKIEAGKQRCRSQKKEIKSRVLQGLGTSTSSTASTSSSIKRPAGDANNNANNKDKRRARTRPDNSISPNQETARSSVRSSTSDLSSAHSKEILKRPQRKNCIDAHQPNNNQLNSSLSSKSNLAPTRKPSSIKSVQSNVNAKQKNAASNKVADRNTTNTNNHTTGGVSPKDNASNESPTILNNHNGHHLNHNNHHNNSHHQHNHNINNNNNNSNSHHNNRALVPVNETGPLLLQQQQEPVTSSSSSALVAVSPLLVQPTKQQVETRDQESQVDLPEELVDKPDAKEVECNGSTGSADAEWRDRAESMVQGLAVTVQYLSHQLEKEDATKENLNQEREEYHQALENLRQELKEEQSRCASLEQTVQQERRRCEKYQETLQEREREHRAALEQLEAEYEYRLQELRNRQPAESSALIAEIESLRTVLQLRSQEIVSLRCDSDTLNRTVEERDMLKIKCEGLEARCEDLKEQLSSRDNSERKLQHDYEVLMGSLHQMSKQNKRLVQKNEELYWRLRQKTEAVSALRNQLTPQSQQRLSKSLGPEHEEHQPANCSNCSEKSDIYEPQTCSMIKYMIEKSDSVSWTLDITDSFEGSSGCCPNKTPSPAARKRPNGDKNGGVSRQGSMRLNAPRRNSLASGRARSSSLSVAESARQAAAKAAAAVAEEKQQQKQQQSVWSPAYNSTPLQPRRRDIANLGETSWSLSNNIMESSSCSSSGNIVCAPNSSKIMTALEVLTTDEEEEEAVGQRPQEAGGEAMISEETSTSSSSEEDDSSVSSTDIP